MKAETKSICAGVLVALCLAAPAAAGTMEVVNAGDEYAAAHPHPHARAAGKATSADFQSTMDQVFGQGRWRETSGYRSQAQENALRRQGAGTVASGHTSLHSVGDADAPGAYDAVVARMSAAQAAAKLKRAGVGFHRVLAERAHGREGPHLHVELISAQTPARDGPSGSRAGN